VTGVVLDTNVTVAGVLAAAGPPAWILDAALAGDLEMAFDAAIREEYADVLHRREFGLVASRVADLLAAFDRFGLLVTAPPAPAVALPDADDEPFLAVAAAIGAVLVTGNLRHFPAARRGGVVVLSPREFVDALRRQNR
jgi:predicted nucleic acid-binding protein